MLYVSIPLTWPFICLTHAQRRRVKRMVNRGGETARTCGTSELPSVRDENAGGSNGLSSVAGGRPIVMTPAMRYS